METTIEIGQIWKSDDPRESRKLMVIGLEGEYVELGNIKTKKKTMVRCDRMKPGSRGFSLVG